MALPGGWKNLAPRYSVPITMATVLWGARISATWYTVPGSMVIDAAQCKLKLLLRRFRIQGYGNSLQVTAYLGYEA